MKQILEQRVPALRRVASLVSLVAVISCGGSSEPNTITPPQQQAAVATVVVTPATATLNVGATQQLTAATQSAAGVALTGRTVTWTSSAEAVATVSTSGLVTAVAGGTATITATSEGRTGTATITVSSAAPVATVTVTPATTTIPQRESAVFTAQARDSAGQTLSGRTVTWSSSDTLVVRVASTTGFANAIGQGTATVTATIDGRTGTSAVTVTPVQISSIALNPTAASIEVGGTRQFTATPRDLNGGPITDRQVTFSVRNSGVATVSSAGLVTGVSAGSTYLLATAEPRTDSALINVTVGPVPVASVDITPTPVTLLSGAQVKLRPFAFDGTNGPLPGRNFTFTSSNTAVATVGADSIVRAVGVGSAIVTATSGLASDTVRITVPSATSQFNLELRNIGPAFTPEVAEAFESARAYWQQAIIGDLPDILLAANRTTPACGAGSGTPTLAGESIDDLVIFVDIDSIDGRGSILGQAGPCLIRVGAGAPTSIAGIMIFDSADIARVTNFREVIRHEMGHVLGIGTLWDEAPAACFKLVSAAGNTQDTHFDCAPTVAAFNAIGGDSYSTGFKVPVENCAVGVPASCGPGTINGHWREAVFQTELMTGYLAGGIPNPSSLVTVQSLSDIGYVVNLGAAESFVRPGSTLSAFLRQTMRATSGSGMSLGNDVWRGPIERINRSGQTISIKPARD